MFQDLYLSLFINTSVKAVNMIKTVYTIVVSKCQIFQAVQMNKNKILNLSLNVGRIMWKSSKFRLNRFLESVNATMQREMDLPEI